MGYKRAADTVRLRELQDGFRDRVLAELAPPAKQSIADLQQHFDEDRHSSPEQIADYRRQLSAYGRSGTPQAELTLEPPSCA